MEYVRRNSISIIKIIMPKLCTKDRKLLPLWYVSVIRLSLLFSPRAPRSRGRHRSSVFRSDNQTDAHDQDNTGSCSNVQTDGIERVEISPVSVVLELQDDQDEHVPIQEATEEPQPFSPQTVEVAMEPEVEMTVPLQRDDNAVPESGLATSEGPQQPALREYNPQRFGNETFTRDFQPKWFKQYPWLNYSVDGKVATCYACSTFFKNNAFTFSNWKKPERLT